jgi:hypothetical protein
MDASGTRKRYVLLVGIDLYLNDGSRTLENGQIVSLDNLAGCVNDIKAMEAFLQSKYQIDHLSTLTSALPDTMDKDDIKPAESSDRLPTFINIKREFDAVYRQANAGDLFLFHFSGHGARLNRVKGSPAGRLKDPSLLTMDFCCGQPALRGWQLNEWLKRLHEKGVQVVVVLDSCYSGGAWRAGGRFRTPNKWPSLPNLPTDELAVEVITSDSVSRNAELETSWAIDPKGFTLLAACTGDEKAAENTINGKARGAFTHALLNYLERVELAVTYRMIRDHLMQCLTGQSPRVYGRDKLLFFGSKEPFCATPLFVQIEGDTVIVPVGKAHGIHRKSEFMPFPPTTEITFSIENVGDFECSATISPELIHILQDHQYMVIPSRWSLGDEPLKLTVDSSFGSAFQQSLYEYLQCQISSSIEVIEGIEGDRIDGNPNTLRLEQWAGDAKIFGPKSLVGYSGPVRPLQLVGDDPRELAADAAAALGHLARYNQILNLGAQASQEPPPFEVTLEPVNGGTNMGPLPHNQKLKFRFVNNGEDDLYFTIMLLGPAFHVEQFYPTQDYPWEVAAGGKKEFVFNMSLPSSGPQWALEVLSNSTRRDIFRTLVTKGKQVSWKTLELPEIWDTRRVEVGRGASRKRHARPPCIEAMWWVQDREVITGPV